MTDWRNSWEFRVLSISAGHCLAEEVIRSRCNRGRVESIQLAWSNYVDSVGVAVAKALPWRCCASGWLPPVDPDRRGKRGKGRKVVCSTEVVDRVDGEGWERFDDSPHWRRAFPERFAS